jgi:hypothetical protein
MNGAKPDLARMLVFAVDHAKRTLELPLIPCVRDVATTP